MNHSRLLPGSARVVCVAAGALLMLTLTGCHRAPRTAAELAERLPRRWEGEVRLRGERDGRKIALEVRQLTVRSEHVLEFNRVRYQAFAGRETLSEGEAAIRGTISAPGGEVRLEEEGTDASIGNAEVLKPGTFQGRLSDDLKSLEATWKTGFDQNASIKLKAVP